MQVEEFLARYPPFYALTHGELGKVARQAEIGFFPAGTVILRQSAEPAEALYVVRTGAVELLHEGRVVDLLLEGEVFGHESLLSELGSALEARAHEDSLCYLVDRESAELVLGSPPGLAYLSASLLRGTSRATMAGDADRPHPRSTQVGRLIRRPPLVCAASTPVRAAAQTMANERVSSLLVESRQGMGIITDRDLRTRVLAPGRASQTPVEAVMSSPLITVSADMPVEEVLLTMLEQGVHHLPVTGDGGSIVGVVTDTDIMGLARADVFALRAEIERAPSRSEAVAAARRLPEVFRGLVDSDVDPVHIGRGIAATIDVLTRRLIEHAIGDQGSPPAPWAWLALGSQGRREQALTTDQDHGLVYQTGGLPADQVDEYFLAVAHSVVQGLEEAGIRRCPGGVMSDNPLWRMPIDRWRAELRHWMSESSPDSRVFPSIALDYRRVAGPLDVEPLLDAEIRMAPEHPQFVRQLVRHALKERPPTGFLRDVVVEDSGEHAGTFDVKHGGIMPITNLARALAVGLGNTSNETLERIRAAMAAGRLERTLGENLAEAFRLLWRVRLDHHADQVEGGTFPDDHVDPSGLDAITRGALKDALRTIARAQRATVLVTGMGPR